jgi:phosphoadenosine phosphosulfate reductase
VVNGKDSQTIYHLALEAGVKFDAHYNLTTVDPPELVRFVRENYPEVTWNRPKETMWKLIERKGLPPTRRQRYCCEILKEGGGEGRFVITGVRWAESLKRKNNRAVLEIVTSKIKDKVMSNDNDESRKMLESCPTKGKRTLNPIVDWTQEDVWDYLNSRKIEHCELYDQGFTRLGCIGCPLATMKNMQMEFERWPKYYHNYLRAFDRMLRERERETGQTYEMENRARGYGLVDL